MYLFNLLNNLRKTIRYRFSSGYDPCVMKCIFSLLKFDVRIEKINMKIDDFNGKNSDIDILITKNKFPIYIEVKGISNQTNNKNHETILIQHKNHSNILGNIDKNFILFISSNNNTILSQNLTNKLYDFNKHINIFHNKIDKIPDIKKTKDTILTQEFLGFIVSDIIPNFINKYIYYFLDKKNLFIDKSIYDKFNDRMEKSKSFIERERWDKIKNKFEFIDYISIDFIDKNKAILNRYKKSIIYAHKNNYNIIMMNNLDNLQENKIYVNNINFYAIPIFGSHSYNIEILSIYSYFYYIKYNIYFFLFLLKLIFFYSF